MNKTPRRILIGLYEGNSKGLYLRCEAEVVYSHTGQDFIVFGKRSQSKLLDELKHYVSQLIPSQTVIPGTIISYGYPWVQPGEKTLRLFVELENTEARFLKLDFNCRIGDSDGYCLVEMNKHSSFSRDEHQSFLNGLTRLKDTPVIFKGDLRKSSTRWSQITILKGNKAYVLNRCTTKSGLDLLTSDPIYRNVDLQKVSDLLQPLETNFTKPEKYTGTGSIIFDKSGVTYSFGEIRWKRIVKESYQLVSRAMGTILHTADGAWQTDLTSDDSIRDLDSLISGLSRAHLFEGHSSLDLEEIGGTRYS